MASKARHSIGARISRPVARARLEGKEKRKNM
jgi:hypothetical protein